MFDSFVFISGSYYSRRNGSWSAPDMSLMMGDIVADNFVIPGRGPDVGVILSLKGY